MPLPAPPKVVILAADVAAWEQCGLLELCPEATSLESLPDALAFLAHQRVVLALYRPPGEVVSLAAAAARTVLVALEPDDLGMEGGTTEAGVEVLVLPASRNEIAFRLHRAADRGLVAADEERAQLRQQSRRDELTGLPGAWLYRDRLAHALGARTRSGHRVTAALLRLGEGPGGELDAISPARLRGVAARVRTAIRASDTVAHEGHKGAVSRGADAELLLLLPDLDGDDPRGVLQRVLDAATADSVDSPGKKLRAAIGYAVAGSAEVAAEELLLGARAALERARPGEIRAATGDVPAAAAAGDLADSIEIWYQPIMHDNGEVVAIAALPRWRHPALGLLGEAELMLYALDGGLVQTVTRTLLRQVCAQWRRWRVGTSGDVTMAVPLRGALLRHGALLDEVIGALTECDVPPRALVFELNEDDLLASSSVVRQLREAGTAVTIGDFGAGAAALRSLGTCTAGWIKIDGHLVRRLPESSAAMNSTRLLLAMARAQGAEPVAMDVDSDRQLRALRALGCEAFQGWQVHMPARAEALEPLLRHAIRPARPACVVPFRTGD